MSEQEIKELNDFIFEQLELPKVNYQNEVVIINGMEITSKDEFKRIIKKNNELIRRLNRVEELINDSVLLKHSSTLKYLRKALKGEF